MLTRPHAALLGVFVLAACGRTGPLREMFGRETPHQRYARALDEAGLDSTALGREWGEASARAIGDAAQVALPFREAGFFPAENPSAAGYEMPLRRGQRITVTAALESPRPYTLFIDLFESPTDTLASPRHVASAGSGATMLVYEPPHDGAYILRLQPELLRSGRYTLTVESTAALAFPVYERDVRAVQSRFGAERDRGERSHQGIDIFAPRGTPVLAAANGVVSSVGTNALGGKVIWLRDMERGQSLYHAHLDSQLVSSGNYVSVGDTLGLVGNTGNARGTPPHLHFGIYRRGEGAIDPYPWVEIERGELPRLTRDTVSLGRWVRTTRNGTTLRRGPAERAASAARVDASASMRVVGTTAGWLRVELPDGMSGYLPRRAIELTVSPDSATRAAPGFDSGALGPRD